MGNCILDLTSGWHWKATMSSAILIPMTTSWLWYEGENRCELYRSCGFFHETGWTKVQVRLVGHSLAPLYPNPLGSQGKTIQSQVIKNPRAIAWITYSQINLDSPDHERFPLFKDATVEHCVLNPGEMLFIPAFYWHQVYKIGFILSSSSLVHL